MATLFPSYDGRLLPHAIGKVKMQESETYRFGYGFPTVVAKYDPGATQADCDEPPSLCPIFDRPGREWDSRPMCSVTEQHLRRLAKRLSHPDERPEAIRELSKRSGLAHASILIPCVWAACLDKRCGKEASRIAAGYA